MTHTVEERTARLARRFYPYLLPDTIAWAGLRLNVALHDFERVLVRQALLPVVRVVARVLTP